MNRPQNVHSYEEWQEWFVGKIERDFGPKIFFEDEREEIREDYEALVRVFAKKDLLSNAYHLFSSLAQQILLRPVKSQENYCLLYFF